METISSTVQNNGISAVDALWTLIQRQTKTVRKTLLKRLQEDMESKKQEEMVKDSLTKAFKEMESGEVKHNARNLFK